MGKFHEGPDKAVIYWTMFGMAIQTIVWICSALSK